MISSRKDSGVRGRTACTLHAIGLEMTLGHSEREYGGIAISSDAPSLNI